MSEALNWGDKAWIALHWMAWLALVKAFFEPVAQRLGQLLIGKAVSTVLFELDRAWPSLIKEQLSREEFELRVLQRCEEITGNPWVARQAMEEAMRKADPRITIEHNQPLNTLESKVEPAL